jgi:hypothetical protein
MASDVLWFARSICCHALILHLLSQSRQFGPVMSQPLLNVWFAQVFLCVGQYLASADV